MMYAKLHITIRIILLVAVVFFSTGFTSVVKYCSMSQSSECCCESDHSDNTAAQTNEPAVSDQNSPCLTVKVIGGLNDIKAPVTSESSIKILAIDAIPLVSDFITLPTPTHFLSLAYTDDVAPPNGDICIRIGSLLI
jgi:hypothetical protein